MIEELEAPFEQLRARFGVPDTRLRLESEDQAGQAITFVQNDQDIVCPLVHAADV